MKWTIVLSYFHRKIGPSIFCSYPEEKLKDEDVELVVNLMDQIISEGFFTYSFNHSYTMNYYFEIDSNWSRGKKEFLMISIIFNQAPSIETEKIVFTLSNEFSEWLKSQKEIFPAFYSINDIESDKQDNEEIIIKNKSLVKTWIEEFYWAIMEEIQEKIEEDSIISSFDRKDFLATLILLSKGPTSIKDLKEWYSEEFPQNSFRKVISTLFRNQLVFVPQIGGKKKSPFNVHVSKEVKTIINLISLKNKLIKKFVENYKTNGQKIEKEIELFQNILKRVLSEPQIS